MVDGGAFPWWQVAWPSNHDASTNGRDRGAGCFTTARQAPTCPSIKVNYGVGGAKGTRSVSTVCSDDGLRARRVG